MRPPNCQILPHELDGISQIMHVVYTVKFHLSLKVMKYKKTVQEKKIKNKNNFCIFLNSPPPPMGLRVEFCTFY